MPAVDAPEMVYKMLGERLSELREERGASQEDLGTFSGLTRASIANIEKGRQRVLIHQLYQFADFLRVELADLLPHPSYVQNSGIMPEAAAAYLNKLRNHTVHVRISARRQRGRSE